LKKYHVAVIGSGMGGSACALILSKLGYSVILIERNTHPRFALGESGTPALSRKMRFLGRTYGIPELEEMSTYDNIQASGNGVLCGPKEMFQYFVHKKGQFDPGQFGPFPEVIVQTAEVDAQYNRAESDKRFLDIAIDYGVEYTDFTSVDNIDFLEDGALLHCSKDEESFFVSTDFVVDATGFNSIIGKKFNLKQQDEQLLTPLKSRCIFTHFKNIGSFDDIIASNLEYPDRSPVSRARATQHHCFDGGWIWLIPFDNGITSVGVNLDIDIYPMNDKEASLEFWEIVEQYPMINSLLEGRETTMPFVKTKRLQFMNSEIVGNRWAMLPGSAYGLDAWFSTGLGSTFMSIHRLVELLHGTIFAESRYERKLLLGYEEAMKKEYFHVAKMVNGMYKSFKHFEIFKSYCSLCFMGTESYLEKGGAGKGMDINHLLLSAGDEEFVEKFNIIYDRVISSSKKNEISQDESDRFRKFISEELCSFNFRRFGDPELHGVHKRVAVKISEYD
jgi:FADH2 O2-dependent halogenase